VFRILRGRQGRQGWEGSEELEGFRTLTTPFDWRLDSRPMEKSVLSVVALVQSVVILNPVEQLSGTRHRGRRFTRPPRPSQVTVNDTGSASTGAYSGLIPSETIYV
jgi:hypothetical protein